MVPTSPYNNSIDDVEQLCSCSQYYDMINDNIMPSMFENSRHPLIVLGIPSTTSSDNLRDYLEVTMEINIVSIFKLGETSAVVLVESAACSMIGKVILPVNHFYCQLIIFYCQIRKCIFSMHLFVLALLFDCLLHTTPVVRELFSSFAWWLAEQFALYCLWLQVSFVQSIVLTAI